MLGLTLEGGGARGSYQIGAWKAFRELGIEFNGITGTSVGALNGALIIQDDFEFAYDLWYNMEPTKVLNIDAEVYDILFHDGIDSKEINIIYKQIIKFVKGFGLDTKPLDLMVTRSLKEDVIRKSNKDFGFVTVCLSDLKPLELYKESVPLGKMAEYLLASSQLPIFKNRKYDGKNFLDGAFYNNLPIDMLYELGYKEVIAVRLNSQGRIKKNNFRDVRVTYIQPHHNLGKVLDFTRDRSRRNLQLGYFDAMRHFKNLKGREYYIIGDISEEKALKYLMTLNEETIIELAELFNLSQYISQNRLLLEGIIPKLFNAMSLRENTEYKDLVFNLLERLALYKKVNTFEIYTLEEFIELLNNKEYDMNLANLNTGNQKTELFKNKNNIIKNVVEILLRNETQIKL